MELFTMPLSKWRLARNHQIEIVDITVKAGNSIFMGTWDLTLGHKAGRISDEEYTTEYKRLMNESYKAHRERWMEFIQQSDPVALACYCTANSARHVRPDGSFFCHRFVLKDILQRLCDAKGIEFRYYGELD